MVVQWSIKKKTGIVQKKILYIFPGSMHCQCQLQLLTKDDTRSPDDEKL